MAAFNADPIEGFLVRLLHEFEIYLGHQKTSQLKKSISIADRRLTNQIVPALGVN